MTDKIPAELTDDERAALESIPDDAVSHWWNGEKWDFEKKVWIPFHVRGDTEGTASLNGAPKLTPLDTARCLVWLRRRDVIDTRESEALTAAIWYLDRLCDGQPR